MFGTNGPKVQHGKRGDLDTTAGYLVNIQRIARIAIIPVSIRTLLQWPSWDFDMANLTPDERFSGHQTLAHD